MRLANVHAGNRISESDEEKTGVRTGPPMLVLLIGDGGRKRDYNDRI